MTRQKRKPLDPGFHPYEAGHFIGSASSYAGQGLCSVGSVCGQPARWMRQEGAVTRAYCEGCKAGRAATAAKKAARKPRAVRAPKPKAEWYIFTAGRAGCPLGQLSWQGYPTRAAAVKEAKRLTADPAERARMSARGVCGLRVGKEFGKCGGLVANWGC